MKPHLLALVLLLHPKKITTCGRAALTHAPERLLSLTGAASIQGSYHNPLFNAAPSMDLPVLMQGESQSRTRTRILRVMRWGMKAAHGPLSAGRLNSIINARCETIATKPTFKPHLEKRRCVVPFDGWYEWTKDKVPHFVRHKGGDRLVMLAGLYDDDRHPASPSTTLNASLCAPSFTIVTVQSSERLHFLHHRMPVVLDSQEAIDQWLSVGEVPFNACRKFLKPYQGPLDTFPVSRRVGNVRNNDASCMKAVEGGGDWTPGGAKVGKVRRTTGGVACKGLDRFLGIGNIDRDTTKRKIE